MFEQSEVFGLALESDFVLTILYDFNILTVIKFLNFLSPA